MAGAHSLPPHTQGDPARTRWKKGETMSAEQKLVVEMEVERETKNTKRFTEIESDNPPILGTQYVQLWALRRLGNPTRIRVTIEAAD